MFHMTTLLVYLMAVCLLVMSPGPDTLYVLASSIGQGHRAGLYSVLGICTGALVHITAAAIGISALLMTSVVAFNIVKFMGAAYLIYLGARALLSRESHHSLEERKAMSMPQTFFRGFLSNLLNPKVAIFFLSFVPQFVEPARGMVAGQIVVLGLIIDALAAIWLSMIALLAGSAARWLNNSPGFWRGQRWFSGTIFIALGARIALMQRSVR